MTLEEYRAQNQRTVTLGGSLEVIIGLPPAAVVMALTMKHKADEEGGLTLTLETLRLCRFIKPEGMVLDDITNAEDLEILMDVAGDFFKKLGKDSSEAATLPSVVEIPPTTTA
jgi:hypothetical protein